MESRRKKVYFIDQTSEGHHHMVFNASMIKILMLIYPDQQIQHYGIVTNQESVKELLGEESINKVNYHQISNPKVKGNNLVKSLNYIRKELIRFLMFYKILSRSNKDDIIFLSITTFTSFYFFKLLKSFYRTKVLAVLHGDIDFIYFPTNGLEKLNAWVHKRIFKRKLPDFKYVLLNKIAKRQLIADGYFKDDELFEIDHPFVFTERGLLLPTQALPVKIGHIGSMEVERKNSHLIYDLAEQLQDKIINKKLIFSVAGLITPGVIPYKNKWVHEVVGNKQPDKPNYLTRAQYELELESLNYCIFFYPQHQYVFRASGAIVDLISKEIPVIVLKHRYFEYLFQIGGNIGFLCENMEDMKRLIAEIADGNSTLLNQYEEQRQNLQQLRLKLSIDNIANDLRCQVYNYLNL